MVRTRLVSCVALVSLRLTSSSALICVYVTLGCRFRRSFGLSRTAGLSDYEVRDVNDDINKLLREKRHWENQIVSLGGANYRRNVPMIDEDGKEVPGTKGYKCVLLLPWILSYSTHLSRVFVCGVGILVERRNFRVSKSSLRARRRMRKKRTLRRIITRNS